MVRAIKLFNSEQGVYELNGNKEKSLYIILTNF